MFIKHAHEQFGILFVLRASDLPDAVEGAEGTWVCFAPKHHHLIRDDVHSNVLGGTKRSHLSLIYK